VITALADEPAQSPHWEVLSVRENRATTETTEISQYIRIYTELIDFQNQLMARASGPPRPSSSPAEVTGLEQQLFRLESRRRFWCGRLQELRGIDLDADDLTVKHAGRTSALTRREFELLSYLLKHPDRVFPANQLAHLAWGAGYLGDDQVRTYVTRLRRKMVRVGLPCRVVNMPRKGYSLVFD
jgi:Transcriptional regulatory protein, C terminal